MSKEKTNLVYKIIIILLIIIIAWLFYDKITIGKTNNQLERDVETTSRLKDSLKQELSTMYIELDELKTNNTQINDSLIKQQQKVKELIVQLNNTKATDRANINKLKSQIRSMQEIMRSYISQIDSLNIVNADLKQENSIIRNDLNQVVEHNKELTGQKDSLEQTVSVAKELLMSDVSIHALNKRDKKTDRSKKTFKFKVCLTLSENKVAGIGKKRIYLRLTEPTTSKVMLNEESGEFNFKGEMIAYSAVKEINYSGDETPVCVFFRTNGYELPAGKYTAFIFIDGYEAGNIDLKLK